MEVNLAPGKEIELYEVKRELWPAGDSGNNRFQTLFGTGKVGVQYEPVLGNTGAGQIKLAPGLERIATGKLELEIKSDPPPGTVWGKEVGGLRAGLGFHPGEKRAYRHGETVKLVVRVRNVSKEEVRFDYLYPHIENSLTVTDGDGKLVPQLGVNKTIGTRLPLKVTLPPGKEIELHELQRQLRPASESGNKDFSTLYGTGKVSVQYEQVLGDPAMGQPKWKLDPTLSKLATGKLELEVKEAEMRPTSRKTWTKRVSPHGARRSAACKRAWASAPARIGLTTTARRSSSYSGFATSPTKATASRRRSSSSTSMRSSWRILPR